MNPKCIVVDLDDTLWLGNVGEVGPAGIDPLIGFQRQLKALCERGVILAACSKNDEDTALAAFNRLNMPLKLEHFSAFVANWNDKAENIEAIAQTLNIGLDSIVFVDDSPFERGRVRQALPMVAVADDPGSIDCYFPDGVITEEDRNRAAFYRVDQQREKLRRSAGSVEEYLQSLDMKLTWSYFDREGLPRIHQLINKTNQFNLTTRRYREKELEEIIDSPMAFGLQFRLADIFGDNGMIAVIIAAETDDCDLFVDAWAMSCRVIGRQIEAAMFEVLRGIAFERGYRRVVGRYLPTSRNGIVRDHYRKLGFASCAGQWEFNLGAT